MSFPKVVIFLSGRCTLEVRDATAAKAASDGCLMARLEAVPFHGAARLNLVTRSKQSEGRGSRLPNDSGGANPDPSFHSG